MNTRSLAVLIFLFARVATIADDLGQTATLEKQGKYSEACDELESIILDDPAEPTRQAALKKLQSLLPKAAPPLTAVERELVDAIAKDNPAGRERLLGRYTIVLATPKFAARARQNGFMTVMDLAYVVLRDLFAVDPVKLIGHRYIIFPQQGKPGGYTTQTQTLKLMIGESDWDNADWFERFFHELSHPFINLQPLEHWRCSGIGEGWAEFCQAYVPQRLECLGPPYKGRFDWYVKEFRKCGLAEYLHTRLPIEEIISYGPSSSLLMALLLTTGDNADSVDWAPFKHLFRSAAKSPPPRTPINDWPSVLAYDAMTYFDPGQVRPILRKYRFPPEPFIADVPRMRSSIPTEPLDCAARRARWSAAQSTVITDWKVLGPIPDSRGERLRLDPIDDDNFVFKNSYTVGGRSYAWRTDAKVDPCGTIYLGDLPGGNASCVFYLYARLPETAKGPLRFWINSDDDCRCWINNERFHTCWAERGIDVDQTDYAFADGGTGGAAILVKVANHGGVGGFFLRYASDEATQRAYKDADEAGGIANRVSFIEFLGSRRVPRILVLPFLAQSLTETEASIRAAAAQALGGRRNDPEVVNALVDQWAQETDTTAASAIRDALAELTFQTFPDAAAAAKWWNRNREDFARRDYVEAERVYGVDPVVGGFFGNNPGAFGGQCIDRGWGSDPSNMFEVTLRAAAAGPRKLRIRCTDDDPKPCALRVAVRRGPKLLFEKKDIAVPRTTNRSTWRWLIVPIPSLEPGRYHVEVTVSRPGGAVDIDTLGW